MDAWSAGIKDVRLHMLYHCNKLHCIFQNEVYFGQLYQTYSTGVLFVLQDNLNLGSYRK